jgi:DNA-binding transcriptional LysR family regulator
MREPSWDDIRVFLAVAEAGSLSAAAQALGLSQPTAGRRLKALETDLGLRLVERISNRIELTEAGHRIRARALGLSGLTDAIRREAQALAGREPEAVRISATGSISLFLAARIADLSAGTGGIPLVVDASRERMNLARREADIAIRMRRLPEDGDLVARKVARLGFTIYGPAGGDPASAPVVGLPQTDRRPSQSGFLDDWAQARPVPIRLSDLALRHRAVKAARGMTLLPCWLGDSDPDLVRILPPPGSLSEDVYLLTRRDSRESGPVGAVLQALVQLFKVHAPALAGREP